ncbi:MAG: GntR family transcriptional regulator [Pirellulaceae bacterium]
MNVKSSLLLKRSTTQESVVDHLRDLILHQHFKPGERLVQSDLAEQLGVSRTPIREALHKLAAEGLVEFSAYKGASVAEFSIEDLDKIYNVRIALEGYAAYLAAQEIDEVELLFLENLLVKMKAALEEGNHEDLLQLNRKFHTRIYSISGQPRLFELITNHLDLAEVYRQIFVNLDHARIEMVSHEEVLLALRRGDAAGAERLTRMHLRRTASTITQFLLSRDEPG